MAWSTPLRIANYLSDPLGQAHLRPRANPGSYAVSESAVYPAPGPGNGVLDVGEGTCLRSRVGEWRRCSASRATTRAMTTRTTTAPVTEYGTTESIGAQLFISHEGARKAVLRALDRLPQPGAQELRRLAG